MAVNAWRLQPEERLLIAEVLRQRAIAENVAVVSGHAKDGSALSVSLQRHDGPLLPGQSLRRAEEFHDFTFALPQLTLQVRRQHAGWSIAAQLIAVERNLNVTATQFCEEGCHAHNAISSRWAASPIGGFGLVNHDSPSTTSASPPTVGCSKRLRSDRSTAKASRIRDTALIATRDWAPRLKKSSLI